MTFAVLAAPMVIPPGLETRSLPEVIEAELPTITLAVSLAFWPSLFVPPSVVWFSAEEPLMTQPDPVCTLAQVVFSVKVFEAVMDTVPVRLLTDLHQIITRLDVVLVWLEVASCRV